MLRKVCFLDLLFEMADLALLALALSEFLLNRLQLLPQQIFPLGLSHFGLSVICDLVAKF